MLPERVHVHVALHGPPCACDVPQPGCGQVEGRLAVGKGSDHPGSAPDLAHDAFEGIIGPDAAPMLVGKGVVDEGLVHGLLEPGGYLGKAQGFELGATSVALALTAARLSWAWMALSMKESSRTLLVGTWLKAFLYQWTTQRCHSVSG